MKNFLVLTEAISHIEENLCEPVSRDQVAVHCHVSLSMLEKLFRYALKNSIKEYLSKRRITRAASDLIHTDKSILDISLKYQYNSPEVFSRAFKRLWGISPSRFTKKWRFTGIFPKINYNYQKGGDIEMARKFFDLSDAYDYFAGHQGSKVICFDACNLTSINEISRKAGDLAILEIASRINEAASEDMLMLRIGGDEFALITGMTDLEAAKQLAAKVIGMNGKPIVYDGRIIPLSLTAGITSIPETGLRYSEFFTDMYKTICDSKRALQQ